LAVTPERRRNTRVAAYGLIRRERQIVLCRVSEQLRAFAGQWTLPGGGVEFGEDPAAAMVREVREETGFIVRPRSIAGIDSKHVEHDDHAFHAIRILFHADIVDGELTSERDGTTDLCCWWSIDALDEITVVDLVPVGLRLAFPDL
jgi:8-oxo-dGTP diphosphatase